jgi:acetyl esterase/lipase
MEDRTVLSTYTVDNLAYGPDPHQVLDVISNTTYTSAPVVFLLHGGQFTGGSKTTLERQYSNYFLSQGFVVVGVDYRLVTPNGGGGFSNQFPTPVVDVASAITFFQANAARFGANPNEIVLQGTSAGADIATMIAYDPAGIPGFTNWGQAAPIHVAGVFVDSGEYNWSLVPANLQFVVADYLGSLFNTPAAIPTEAISYVHAGLPPTLVVAGALDNQSPFQQSTNLANALQAAGDPVTFQLFQNLGHGNFSKNFASSPTEQALVTGWLQSIGL